MPNPAHTISTRRADGGDVLVYSDGEDRSIEFSCRATIDPVPVWIPLGRWWTERAPPWAQAQRDAIVERVRAWGAIVYEAQIDSVGNTLTTIQSPDRAFRIECLEEPDDRAPAWESTRIIVNAGDEVLADLRLHAVTGLVEFARPGTAILNLLGRYGDRQRLRIDVANRVFHVDGDPDSSEHPLHMLAARLAPPKPPTQTFAPPAGGRQRGSEFLIGAIGAPFALGGLWLALSGKSASDRLAGIAGVVMGGFAVANAVAEWRKRRPVRRVAVAAGASFPSTRLAPYIPLLAIGVELAWLAVLLIGFLFVVGDRPYTHTPGAASVRFWDLIAALPALAGLSFGVVSIVRGRAQRIADWICLVLGSAGCGLFVLIFGTEFFH